MSWRRITICFLFLLLAAAMDSCHDVLEPEPIDLIVNDVVLNEAKDIPVVEVGLYSAFRGITPNVIIAGDLTADMLLHIGTFSQYRELGVKRITAANASVAALWGSIYATVYIANFMIERIPEISGVTNAQRQRSLATAHLIRGMAYFIGAYSFGAMPLVTTTDIETNRNIGRQSKADILNFVEQDFLEAAGKLTTEPVSPSLVSEYAVLAALARFNLYAGNWAAAEAYASQVINSDEYELESNFSTLVFTDFTQEAIFEVGYTIADDPATLNTLFKGRREIIPANQQIIALASNESGDRFSSIVFDVNQLKGSDNGWAVAKYGTAVEDNNNIVVFRLAEMFLIRAEARAHLGKTNGTGGAQEDVNALRTRAKAPLIGSLSQSQMLLVIEDERKYEFAFEGHRWFDLVRTSRSEQVMPAFNANWRPAYQLWPVPQREIQSNPGLANDQNPGY